MNQANEPKVFQFPGLVARVYRPDLTEAERTKRLEAIHNQAANLLKAAERIHKEA